MMLSGEGCLHGPAFTTTMAGRVKPKKEGFEFAVGH